MIATRAGMGNIFTDIINLSTGGVYGDAVANASGAPVTDTATPGESIGEAPVSTGSMFGGSDMGYIIGAVAVAAMLVMFFNNPQAKKRRARIGKAKAALDAARGMSMWL